MRTHSQQTRQQLRQFLQEAASDLEPTPPPPLPPPPPLLDPLESARQYLYASQNMNIQTSSNDDENDTIVNPKCYHRPRYLNYILLLLGIIAIMTTYLAGTNVYHAWCWEYHHNTTTIPQQPQSQDSRLDDIQNHIIKEAKADPLLFQTQGTPQREAIKWLYHQHQQQQHQHASSTKILLVEQYALAVLYFSTQGSPPHSWNNHDPTTTTTTTTTTTITTNIWMTKDSNCCQWHGIHCSSSSTSTTMEEEDRQQQYVIQVNLTHNGLRQQIPTELGLLRHLKQLHLEFNQLTGAIPKELAQSWTSLESLHLEGNWLLTNNENLEPLCSKQHHAHNGSGGGKRREIVVNCENDIPCSCCTCYEV